MNARTDLDSRKITKCLKCRAEIHRDAHGRLEGPEQWGGSLGCSPRPFGGTRQQPLFQAPRRIKGYGEAMRAAPSRSSETRIPSPRKQPQDRLTRETGELGVGLPETRNRRLPAKAPGRQMANFPRAAVERGRPGPQSSSSLQGHTHATSPSSKTNCDAGRHLHMVSLCLDLPKFPPKAGSP